MLEAVEDERTGFVFRSQDATHLAQRIGEIFSVSGHSSAIGQAGLRMVSARNDWAYLGEQALVCYQRALKPAA